MRKYLTKDEVKALLNKIDNPLDYMLIFLCYNLGLRVGELVRLRIDDFDFVNKVISIPTLKWEAQKKVKKGTIQRGILPKTYIEYPMDRIIGNQVYIYLKKTKPKYWLFPNGKSHIPEWKVQRRFKKWAKQIGLPPHYSIHSLRHSRGYHVYEATGDLAKVQEILRHKDIATTRIYATMSVSVKRKVLDMVGSIS